VLQSEPTAPIGLPNQFTAVKPATPLASTTALHNGAPRLLINTTHASVDYRIDQVGPSGIGKVDIWLTTDSGSNWKKLCEDHDRRSPAEIDLPGEGLYGLRLVVTNGNGFGGRSPAHGDNPTNWIEVDITPPIIQLREMERSPTAAPSTSTGSSATRTWRRNPFICPMRRARKVRGSRWHAISRTPATMPGNSPGIRVGSSSFAWKRPTWRAMLAAAIRRSRSSLT